ncbi:ribosomal protein L7/L12, partial [Ochromonadaceae sp. CCMP2298]
YFALPTSAYDAKVKIKIIKEVRAITGLGLKEAKEMVENAPIVVKQGLKKEEAEKLMQVLADAGAKAELI